MATLNELLFSDNLKRYETSLKASLTLDTFAIIQVHFAHYVHYPAAQVLLLVLL